MKNITKIDYISLDEIKGYEFGLIVHLEEPMQPVEVLVIHHESYMTRTLDFTEGVSNAENIAESFIQRGFNCNGLKFSGISNYHLPIEEENVNVSII
ncbi:hypothetical protein MKZ20_21630 [Psychrobacillus sp. FSL K6-2684]|uniref:hypothetical protein n=1 Tax=unclassified Psychrobacillus TaxID=2636677 RepID=UPI002042018F|nr:hypothetical protein [Psychrobacillus sp. MER TA 171]MCM3358110.1 hypothetical protein [Psychrobacillus sp. MER TA 171]